MAMKQLVSHLLAGALVIAGLAVVQSAAPATAAGTNLALGKTATASSFTDVYPAANVNDGNANTYWESVNNAFPQWVQLDLGSSTSVNQVVLALPPATSWATRTETLSVQGSTDGSTFSTVVGSAGYTFNPATGNTVTINFTALSTRFVRLNITGNTGWPAGQLSEFQLYGPTAGDTQPPTAPGNLAYSQPGSGQVALSWTASTDNVGVTGYTVYRNGALLTSLGNVLSYTDTAAGTGTVSYYVTARDAAGNVSPASNTVTRTGSGGGSNLALGKPISGSANTYIYAPANANDNDTTTYFEGASYPSTLTVKLGANTDLSSVVLKLNPSSSWGPRSQTIQVLGREQSATGFTALTSPTAYSFDPATGNSVTVPVSGRVADVELSITSNTGAPGGQVAEFQIYGSAAPNPDLTVTGSSWTPAAPVETDSITVSATVKNTGALAAPASSVNFYLGTTKVGTAAVSALAAGASATVSANIGAQNAGSYSLTAKVDEANSIIESNETNNNYTNPTQLTVAAVSSSDLLPVSISWSPTNPAAGNTVTFSAAIKNQGSIASASGAHGLTLNLIDSS
ncbi:MAG: CARDB domain-containing protein, partial [Jatrophihabitantaceae bacterium]